MSFAYLQEGRSGGKHKLECLRSVMDDAAMHLKTQEGTKHAIELVFVWSRLAWEVVSLRRLVMVWAQFRRLWQRPKMEPGASSSLPSSFTALQSLPV